MGGFPQLTEDDFRQFENCLNEIISRSGGSLALLVEKAGHLICKAGGIDDVEPSVFATLASNAYNATAFMANMLTESRFSMMFQQGAKYNTIILDVDEHCIVVVVFKSSKNVATVRYYASVIIPKIAEQLQVAKNRGTASYDLTDLNVTDVASLFSMEKKENVGGSKTGLVESVDNADPLAKTAVSSAISDNEINKEEKINTSSHNPEMESQNMAKKAPYIIDVEPGKYYWCSCGLSRTQPFCDGSHKGTEFRPLLVEIDKTQKKAFCGCKKTKNPPYCDGTHSKL